MPFGIFLRSQTSAVAVVVAARSEHTAASTPINGNRYIYIQKVGEVGGMVDFNITDQSHHGDLFCPDGKRFKTSFGYELRSGNFGGPGHYSKGQVYVRSSQACCDNITIRVSKTEFAQIERAVAEYNEIFKDSMNAPKAPAATAKKAPAKKKVVTTPSATSTAKFVERINTDNNKYEVIGMIAELISVREDFCSVKLPNGSKQEWLNENTKPSSGPVFDPAKGVKKAPATVAKKEPVKQYVKRLNCAFNGVEAGDIVELVRVMPVGRFAIINPHESIADNEDTWNKKNGELMPEGWAPAKKPLTADEKRHIFNGGTWVPKVGDIVKSISYGHRGRVVELGVDAVQDDFVIEKMPGSSWYTPGGGNTRKTPDCFDLEERP